MLIHAKADACRLDGRSARTYHYSNTPQDGQQRKLQCVAVEEKHAESGSDTPKCSNLMADGNQLSS